MYGYQESVYAGTQWSSVSALNNYIYQEGDEMDDDFVMRYHEALAAQRQQGAVIDRGSGRHQGTNAAHFNLDGYVYQDGDEMDDDLVMRYHEAVAAQRSQDLDQAHSPHGFNLATYTYQQGDKMDNNLVWQFHEANWARQHQGQTQDQAPQSQSSPCDFDLDTWTYQEGDEFNDDLVMQYHEALAAKGIQDHSMVQVVNTKIDSVEGSLVKARSKGRPKSFITIKVKPVHPDFSASSLSVTYHTALNPSVTSLKEPAPSVDSDLKLGVATLATAPIPHVDIDTSLEGEESPLAMITALAPPVQDGRTLEVQTSSNNIPPLLPSEPPIFSNLAPQTVSQDQAPVQRQASVQNLASAQNQASVQIQVSGSSSPSFSIFKQRQSPTHSEAIIHGIAHIGSKVNGSLQGSWQRQWKPGWIRAVRGRAAKAGGGCGRSVLPCYL